MTSAPRPDQPSTSAQRFHDLLTVTGPDPEHVLFFLASQCAQRNMSWSSDHVLWKIALRTLQGANSSQVYQVADALLGHALQPVRKVRQLLHCPLSTIDILLLLTSAVHDTPSVVLVSEIAKLYDPTADSRSDTRAAEHKRGVLGNALISEHKHMFQALITNLKGVTSDDLLFIAKELAKSNAGSGEHAVQHWQVLLPLLPPVQVFTLLYQCAQDCQQNSCWTDNEPLLAQAATTVFHLSFLEEIGDFLSSETQLSAAHPTLKKHIDRALLTAAIPPNLHASQSHKM